MSTYVYVFRQLLAVGRCFPPGTPVSSTRELISSSFHRLDMTLAVAEALNPNKKTYVRTHIQTDNIIRLEVRFTMLFLAICDTDNNGGCEGRCEDNRCVCDPGLTLSNNSISCVGKIYSRISGNFWLLESL